MKTTYWGNLHEQNILTFWGIPSRLPLPSLKFLKWQPKLLVMSLMNAHSKYRILMKQNFKSVRETFFIFLAIIFCVWTVRSVKFWFTKPLVFKWLYHRYHIGIGSLSWVSSYPFTNSSKFWNGNLCSPPKQKAVSEKLGLAN